MALLVAGLPDMNDYYTTGNTLDGVGEHPGPLEFTPVLYEALTGAQGAQWKRDGESQQDYRWHAWGHVGDETAGFRWDSRGLVGDSSSYRHTIESYGLALTLVWHMEWLKSGYVHRFFHRSLSVSFATPEAEATFHAVWQRVFGQPAQLR